MSSAGIALFTNLVVAVLLAAAFTALAVYDERRRAARWLALSYLSGIAALCFEFIIAVAGASRWLVVANFAGFLIATALVNVGVASRNGVKLPAIAMTILLLVSMAGVWVLDGWPRESLLRAFLYQAPYAIMQWIGAWIVFRARTRDRFDNALGMLLALSGAHFLLKPLMAVLSTGVGTDPSHYLQSTYALISLSMSAVFAFALALSMLLMLARDMLRDATAKSETDGLSGILNRSGFERQGEASLRDAQARGLPSAVVLADLDHFKEVNDTLGHAAGDRVIEAFGGFLRAAGEHRILAARIGGEEFAMILPGANLASARLFAEGLRSTFGSLAIEGLPPSRRFTASFGVAERFPGEGVADILRRADEALYLAKADGRNCVRVAPLLVAQGGDASLDPATGTAPVTRRYSTSSSGEKR